MGRRDLLALGEAGGYGESLTETRHLLAPASSGLDMAGVRSVHCTMIAVVTVELTAPSEWISIVCVPRASDKPRLREPPDAQAVH